MTDTSKRLAQHDTAVVWYFEGEDRDVKVKHEGAADIYPGWVKLGTPGTWIPRERVEQVLST